MWCLLECVHFDENTGHPDVWLNIISGCVKERFPEEITLWIHSRLHYSLPAWVGILQSAEGLGAQKVGEGTVFSACLSWATSLLSSQTHHYMIWIISLSPIYKYMCIYICIYTCMHDPHIWKLNLTTGSYFYFQPVFQGCLMNQRRYKSLDLLKC